MEGQKQRHPSGGVSVSTEMVLGLEGVELGADGKVRIFLGGHLWGFGWLVGFLSLDL